MDFGHIKWGFNTASAKINRSVEQLLSVSRGPIQNLLKICDKRTDNREYNTKNCLHCPFKLHYVVECYLAV